MGGQRGLMEGLTRCSFPLSSLEFHSNLIADAVKKVIKVGKVSVGQPALPACL